MKEPPRAIILTINAAPTCNDFADIREQGLEIGGQRVAGAMQMTNQLVQIISETHKLAVNQPFDIAARLIPDRQSPVVIEQKGTAEINRSHPDGVGAPLDTFELPLCEA